METIRYERVVDHVIAVTHAPEPVADEEWEAFLAQVRATAREHGRAALLVSARGQGGPDVNQRATLSRLGEEVGGIRMAMLTDSKFLRGVVTALRWMAAIEIQSFAPQQEMEAIEFLHLDREQGIRSLAALHSLATASA